MEADAITTFLNVETRVLRPLLRAAMTRDPLPLPPRLSGDA
jgi:hypothetical protein